MTTADNTSALPRPSEILTELDVWSCNPADIPPWTEEGKQRLTEALAQIFGWNEPENKVPEQAATGSPSDVASDTTAQEPCSD